MCFHSSNCGVFHDYACDCGAQATVNRKAELEAENERLREQLEANMKLMRKAKTVLGHSACFTPEWLTPEVKGLLTTIDAAIEKEKAE